MTWLERARSSSSLPIDVCFWPEAAVLRLADPPPPSLFFLGAVSCLRCSSMLVLRSLRQLTCTAPPPERRVGSALDSHVPAMPRLRSS
jgi:hypothetical protein